MKTGTRKRISWGLAAAIGTFLVLRASVLPSQLNTTPYHDDTLAHDLLRLIFLRVPRWIPATSLIAFAIAAWSASMPAQHSENSNRK